MAIRASVLGPLKLKKKKIKGWSLKLYTHNSIRCYFYHLQTWVIDS